MTLNLARVRTKICCISTPEEAALAVGAGADGLGLVAEMPGGTGVVTLARAAEIARQAPPGVATFMLTSKSRAVEIVAEARAVRPSAVQIVAHLDPAEYPSLRAGLPGVRLVQAVHVEERAATLARAALYGALADAILLDSGRP
ncbi:MAG: phosphoribosylanthranilate isomerase, partial [Hyphomicrobiales bacterium]|nr:phosphoribosylanthranilate isomerase [Hyphomicrobiales bacterium]